MLTRKSKTGRSQQGQIEKPDSRGGKRVRVLPGSHKVHTPTPQEQNAAQDALPILNQWIENVEGKETPFHLRGGEMTGEIHLTPPLLRLVSQLMEEIAAGHAVFITPGSAELTPNQAAQLLGVSRPFLVQLMDRGKIPYRMVGTHRRIRWEDVQVYQAEQDRRHRVLEELAAQAQELNMGY